jgi:hypothetical protein
LGIYWRQQSAAKELLEEVYEAVRGQQYRLAAMGIRALFEHIIISKVGDRGTFGKNLEAFQAGGYISTIQYDSIKAILEAGHATTHRSFKPSAQDLNIMLDVFEGVVGAIEIHPSAATKLGDRVPPRK